MENDKTSVANDNGPVLSPGPWRITGAPNYRNVVDANGRQVCAVVGGVNSEVNARVLAGSYRSAYAASAALRVIGQFAQGDNPAASDIDQVMDELGDLVVAAFGTDPATRAHEASAPEDDVKPTPAPAARRARKPKMVVASEGDAG